MLNKEATEILDCLYRLAINAENQAIKISNNPSFMPLSIELLNLVPWVKRGSSDIVDGDTISVCHYGELNGDLMRDPEMIFERVAGAWVPTYFRNDYVGVEQLRPTEKQKRDMADFANTWMENIKQQQGV